MIQITFKGINPTGKAMFQGYGPNGAFDVIREGIDTYYEYDLAKGHGIGEALKVSFL